LPRIVFAVAGWVFWMAIFSHIIASHAIRDYGGVFSALAWALQGGMVTAGMLMIAVPRPVLLAENGVWLGGAYAPWKYIRHAEWLPDRPGAMKLRRLDGDIYIEVPERMRGEIEAFAGAKTTIARPAQASSSGDAVANRGGDV